MSGMEALAMPGAARKTTRPGGNAIGGWTSLPGMLFALARKHPDKRPDWGGRGGLSGAGEGGENRPYSTDFRSKGITTKPPVPRWPATRWATAARPSR